MRRDLIIGVIASALIHGGLGWGDTIWAKLSGPTKAKVVQTTQEEEVELYVPPPIPEVPPDLTEDTSEEPTVDVASIAPPSLTEVPGNIQVDSFVQVMAPPPPPSLGKPEGGTMTIPKGPPTGGRVASNLGAVFDLKDLDQQPSPRGIRQAPQYPFEMKRAGIEGDVVLLFIVDSNGDTRDITVVRSSHREFEAPAIAAVQKWKFKPGRKGGKAVSTRMQIPIAFSLNEE